MNIRIDLSRKKHSSNCPCCGCPSSSGHGSYVRKGFHVPNRAVALPVRVRRYRCLNPDCRRRTFSILPRNVLPYCRFYWFYLVSLKESLCRGATVNSLAQHVWHVGWAVIARGTALLQRMETWVEQLHRELTDGHPGRELCRMVKIVTGVLGPCELVSRWYRHRYPLRFG